MRTKALLGLAALAAAGVTTAVAQNNVYSLNVVGYVNTPIAGSASTAYQMIANPLNSTNNTIGSLLTTPPDFTVLFKWNGSGFDTATYFFGAWDHPEYTLNPGEGAIVASTAPWQVTFVGEVLQGSLTNDFGSGYAIRSSKVPQTGTLTELGLPGSALSDFDTVLIYNTATQGYDTYTWFFGSWSPSEPTLAVGQSMWLATANGGKWVRTFNVQ